MQISEYFDSVASFWDDDFSEARAARIVASTVSIPRGGACVLDIGCGSGSMFLDLMESGACEIDGVDISPKSIFPFDESDSIVFDKVLRMFEGVMEDYNSL